MKTDFAFGPFQFHRLFPGTVALLGVATLLGAATMFFPRAEIVVQPRVLTHPIRSVVGKWEGAFQSAIDRNFQGMVLLEITEQQHGRFGGNINADVFDPTFQCKGTISPGNEVRFVTERGGDKLTVEGELSGNSMRLQYRAVLSDGLTDEGTLTLAGRRGSESVSGR